MWLLEDLQASSSGVLPPCHGVTSSLASAEGPVLEEGVQSVRDILPFWSGNNCLLWLLPIKADVCGHGEGKTPQKNPKESLGVGRA